MRVVPSENLFQCLADQLRACGVDHEVTPLEILGENSVGRAFRHRSQ
jgi:hypothetical protein